MSTPQPPRPFEVGDRVRTKASTLRSGDAEAGVVLRFRDDDFDTLVRFDGKDEAGVWERSDRLELETPE